MKIICIKIVTIVETLKQIFKPNFLNSLIQLKLKVHINHNHFMSDFEGQICINFIIEAIATVENFS